MTSESCKLMKKQHEVQDMLREKYKALMMTRSQNTSQENLTV